jgi:hypothetical protein
MKLVIRKRVSLGPFVRLNIFNSGFSVSLGHRSLGWITLGRRGIRESVSVASGIYATEGQTWDKVLKALRLRK